MIFLGVIHQDVMLGAGWVQVLEVVVLEEAVVESFWRDPCLLKNCWYQHQVQHLLTGLLTSVAAQVGAEEAR